MKHQQFNLIDHNAKIFFKPKLATYYANEPLAAAEAIIFIRHREAYAGKSVLDIAVGSGRTTRFLLPFASSYLGTDISPAMLTLCRESWPTAEIAELDMRDLAKLSPQRFDFILAPCGVFDVLTHELRLKALADCAGLLAPGGLFVFSGHNRRHKLAGKPPMLDLSGPVLRWPFKLASFIRDRSTHYRMKAFEQHADDYALLNDLGHHWLGVFYYADRAAQIRQIENAGFSLVEVLGHDGRTLDDGADDSEDWLLHYVCQKA
jgi:SAM-dependent methyltransferase